MIPACRDALATAIKTVRDYGSSLAADISAPGRLMQRWMPLRHAYKAGYPAAGFALGMMYFLGDDIATDHDRALMLFTAAYDQGVIWAALGLAEMHADPMSPHHNMDLAAMAQPLATGDEAEQIFQTIILIDGRTVALLAVSFC